MIRIDFDKRVYASSLHDDILAAIPALAGVDDGHEPFLRVNTREDGTGWIDLADDADKAAVQAVLDSYTYVEPTPPPLFVIPHADAVAAAAGAAVGAVVPFLAPGATAANVQAATNAATSAATQVLDEHAQAVARGETPDLAKIARKAAKDHAPPKT